MAEGHVHGALSFAVNMAFGQTIRDGTNSWGDAPVKMAFGHENNAELCNFKTCASGCDGTDSETPPGL